MASDFGELIDALGAALETELTIASDGIAEVIVGPRAICLQAVANGTQLRLFTTVESPLTAAHEALDAQTLTRALQRNLFAQATAGHVIGLFDQTLILSIEYPLETLDAAALADRLLVIARVADETAEALFPAASAAPAAAASAPGDPAPEMLAFLRA